MYYKVHSLEWRVMPGVVCLGLFSQFPFRIRGRAYNINKVQAIKTLNLAGSDCFHMDGKARLVYISRCVF